MKRPHIALGVALVASLLVWGLLLTAYLASRPEGADVGRPPSTSVPISTTTTTALPTTGTVPTTTGRPTTTRTLTTTTRPSLLEDALEDALAGLEPGRILFNPPARMRVADTERVEVRITRSLNEDLTQALRGSGEPQVEDVPRVSAFMSAQLAGEHFAVRALSSQDQVVSERGFAQWEWDVTPTEGGRHPLQLLVSVRLPVAGLPEQRLSVPVFEREIDVEVSALHTVREFWFANWQWLLGSPVVLGAAAAAWRKVAAQPQRGAFEGCVHGRGVRAAG